MAQNPNQLGMLAPNQVDQEVIINAERQALALQAPALSRAAQRSGALAARGAVESEPTPQELDQAFDRLDDQAQFNGLIIELKNGLREPAPKLPARLPKKPPTPLKKDGTPDGRYLSVKGKRAADQGSVPEHIRQQAGVRYPRLGGSS